MLGPPPQATERKDGGHGRRSRREWVLIRISSHLLVIIIANQQAIHCRVGREGLLPLMFYCSSPQVVRSCRNLNNNPLPLHNFA